MNTNETSENYDRLQSLFLQMDYRVDEDILSEKIQEADLKFVKTEPEKSQRHIYTIAFNEEDAQSGFMGCKGDCMAVSYMKLMGGMMLEDVSYIKNGDHDKVAVYRYHYDQENKRYGYTCLYYDAKGDFRGILLNGQNSNMFPCESTKEAMDKVINS